MCPISLGAWKGNIMEVSKLSMTCNKITLSFTCQCLFPISILNKNRQIHSPPASPVVTKFTITQAGPET
jgi:hypothetical protein